MGSWTRLEQVIKWTGLTTNAFALSIGLKRAENLYQIKKGRNSISRDLADLIAAKYSGISKSWLLTGEGSMLTDENEKRENVINSEKRMKKLGEKNYFESFVKVYRGISSKN